MHYQEVIDGNEDFVATIKPALQSGKDTGWDLITLTDWMAAKLIGLDWIEAFEPANVPNLIANIKDVYVDVPWDPNVTKHAPWQSGMTGVGFDNDIAGDVTSLAAAVHGRSALEGQGRVPDRDARRRRPVDALPRASIRRPRRGTAATRPSR